MAAALQTGLAATDLEYAAFPEQVGVDSKTLHAYLDDVLEQGFEAHSILVLRHGKVAYAHWRAPYAPDIPHTMYSVSKSITATAIGLAAEEGILTLDTKVLDVFPEHRPKKPDPWLEEMTVRHLVSMTAGKDVSIFANKAAGDWVGQFFASKWEFEPGKGWKYINENIYMLSAIIHKLTGSGLLAFLQPRLFQPLGITRPLFWETDEKGIEAGGWGLYLTTEELAKIVLCYQQMGKYAGNQIVPEAWVREATAWQADNSRNQDIDSCAGYGYCFWRNALPNSYRFDGMFSQYGFVFEDYDAALVLTNCEMDQVVVRECVARHFPKVFIAENETPLQDGCTDLALPALPDLAAKPHSTVEQTIEGREIHFRRNRIVNIVRNPMSVLTLAALYMSADKAGNIDKLSFRFQKDACEMRWSEGKETNSVLCGMDGTQRRSPICVGGLHFTAACSAAWADENTLDVWVRPLESVCERRMRFCFSGNKVTMHPSSMPTTKSSMDYLAGGIGSFFKNPLIVKILGFGMRLLPLIVEPTHRGRFTE